MTMVNEAIRATTVRAREGFVSRPDPSEPRPNPSESRPNPSEPRPNASEP
jgi:hypothetical protein